MTVGVAATSGVSVAVGVTFGVAFAATVGIGAAVGATVGETAIVVAMGFEVACVKTGVGSSSSSEPQATASKAITTTSSTARSCLFFNMSFLLRALLEALCFEYLKAASIKPGNLSQEAKKLPGPGLYERF